MNPAAIRKLEDEINLLRSKMVLIYMEESSFNSDKVIAISRKLDKKINEYMKSTKMCANG